MDSRGCLKKGFVDNKIIHISDKELKKLHKILIMMLRDFDSVCKKYNIHYSLGGGSVLGAVRHGGIIPWDDDIDINISREDYNKLLQTFAKYTGSKYSVYAPEIGGGHGLACSQIKLNGTVYRSYNELSKSSADSGICIDLFVIENTFDNPIMRGIHGILCLCFGYMLTCRKTYQDYQEIVKYVDKRSKAYRLFKLKNIIGRLFSWIDIDTLTRMTAKIYSMCHNNYSKYVTVPTGRKHFWGELYKRDVLCETISVCFGSANTYIPTKSDIYLKKLYGENYMEIPKQMDQESHPIMEINFGRYK